MTADTHPTDRLPRFDDDVPLEILAPVPPEVHAALGQRGDPRLEGRGQSNPWAEHRAAPPLGPSPLAPSPLGTGFVGAGPYGGPLPGPMPAGVTATDWPSQQGALAPAPPPAASAPEAGAPTNALAIVALALAVAGLPIVGAILGHIALSEIRRRGESGRPLALAAVWIGWGLTGLAALVVVIGLVGLAAVSCVWLVVSWMATGWL